MSKTWAYIQEVIAECGRLPENWDSYGGLPATEIAVTHAQMFASTVEAMGRADFPMPSVCSTGDGGVGFEWDTGDWDAMITIGPDGAATYMIEGRALAMVRVASILRSEAEHNEHTT